MADTALRSRAGTTVTVALALACALIVFPRGAHASGARELTPAGEPGWVRVRPVGLQDGGALAPLQGDPRLPETNPNRTVGDVEPPSPLGNGVPCTGTPVPDDCARTLAPNDPGRNASATDGHTHYHAGDRWIVVNEVKGFEAGDTILIGSTSCNFVALGATCRRFAPGYGYRSEQPDGEVAHVIGGDAGRGLRGPGLLELAEPLARPHAEGTLVAKRATAYTGQQLQVVIPHEKLLGDASGPVIATASLVLPQRLRDPGSEWIRLAVDHTHPLLFERIVSSPEGDGTFYVPRELTGTTTVGATFDVDGQDTWYSVVVSSRDMAGEPVASGVFRFKLNPVAMRDFAVDRTRVPPTYPVAFTGRLRDASTFQARNRPVEDATVEAAVTKPDGSVQRIYTNACANTGRGTESCGGDDFGKDPRHYGDFKMHVGGARGLQFGRGGGGGGSGLCQPCAERNLASALDTSQSGTYRVVARVYGVEPFVGASGQFEVRAL